VDWARVRTETKRQQRTRDRSVISMLAVIAQPNLPEGQTGATFEPVASDTAIELQNGIGYL